MTKTKIMTMIIADNARVPLAPPQLMFQSTSKAMGSMILHVCINHDMATFLLDRPRANRQGYPPNVCRTALG